VSSIFTIRPIQVNEYQILGTLMVDVYSRLKDFPSPTEQPEYFAMLARIGQLNTQPNTSVFVAIDDGGKVLGGVVYYSDMSEYGSGGSAIKQAYSSGIRLLCVDPEFRGMGVGKALTIRCIEQAKLDQNNQVILHTTQAMKVAWSMYDKLGFERSADLDFFQKDLPVFGFKLKLNR
jgi:ribosomal protein S18 acetylase RimI-like enzyme